MGVVVTVPEAALDYAVYGDNSRMISNYLANQMSEMPQVFNAFTSKVYNAMMASYNYVNDTMIKHNLIGTLRQKGVEVIDNYIVPLTDIEQLKTANPTMQRWVMAQPELRQLYLNQNVDGYSDQYRNVFGNEVGEADYNYRRVMDGVLQDDGKESFIRRYHEELYPGDRELDHAEKVMILQTHDYISQILASCDIDFTCKSTEPVKINRE
ncbi:hypothetical protein [Flavobacterium sp.]|uniref:hypothetical protein n=1 Tax=Flavobacterium sp. TaxID=239 RepID=UPI0037C0BE7F